MTELQREAIIDEVWGLSIQIGFKVFRQLLLQLNPSFDIQALEALVTLETMDATFAKAKDKMATRQERVAKEGGDSHGC